MWTNITVNSGSTPQGFTVIVSRGGSTRTVPSYAMPMEMAGPHCFWGS